MRHRIVTSRQFVEATFQPNVRCEILHRGHMWLRDQWHMPNRVVEDHLIYLVEAGRLHCHQPGRTTVIEQGRLIWLQPATPYGFTLDGSQTPTRLIYTRFHVGRQLPIRIRSNQMLVDNDPVLHRGMESLLPAMSVSAMMEPLRVRAVLAQITTQIIHLSQSGSRKQAGLSAPAQKAALTYIHENLHRRFTVKELAKQVGLNAAYFSIQFRRRMNLTPQAYIKQARARHAADLLSETNLTISEVAHRLGYDDVFFFSHQFKDIFGQSPRHWRKSRLAK